MVLLHHVGARSGTTRTSPVMAISPDDDTWLIAASMGGAPTHPAWFHNLRAHPDVSIETPEGTVDVHAEVLGPEERDAAWPLFTQRSDGFRTYQERTERTIPIVRLTRR
nr:nitroreductase/quinone reductase family protein [Microbacterium thalassium]